MHETRTTMARYFTFRDSVGRNGMCRALAALLIAICFSGVGAYATTLNLTQLDFQLDGTVDTLTEWSTIDVQYTGSSSVEYFNLNYNSQWVLQNIPVLSREGLVTQIQQFSFNNGLSQRGITDLSGTSPTSLNYTLTPTLQGMPPDLPTSLTFAREIEIFDTGTQPETSFLLAAPAALVGATAAVLMTASHKGFPNQEAKPFECAPAAISNSLMFLKDKNPSPLWAGKALDIATMKTATAWRAGSGAFIFHNDSRLPPLSKNAFWEDKDAYMKANNYPVMTMTTTNFADILQAMKNMKDVELELKGHTVSLVGITDLGGGKYSLDIAHDAEQTPLPAGGTKVETLTWDGTTLKGAKWLKGFNYAVVEMFVPEPSTWALLVLSGICLIPVMLKRRKFRA